VAGSSLFALLDDIASILDDVAVMSKVAAKKTAGVLGDDLALNAHQIAGVHTDRELPVVLAVAKGSLKNKAILVPAALAISALIPWAITPLLMMGGAYLCYEGCEKIAHKFLADSSDDAHHKDHLQALVNPAVDLVALEKDKIQGAIRTDFILSAEIVVIALGTVANAAFGKQVAVLCAIAILMTVGVYGFVAGIVKLDDAGLHLRQQYCAQNSTRFRCISPASGALSDEKSIDRRDHCHVHGRRRHSRPRNSRRASVGRTCRPRCRWDFWDGTNTRNSFAAPARYYDRDACRYGSFGWGDGRGENFSQVQTGALNLQMFGPIVTGREKSG
jgi:predicted DNA repair protein MutK